MYFPWNWNKQIIGEAMIIFDLDGTLADCEHRSHFVDPDKFMNKCHKHHEEKTGQFYNGPTKPSFFWIKDYRAFYDACDKDTLILPVAFQFRALRNNLGYDEIQIWSGRCESVRGQTEEWIKTHLIYGPPALPVLKMRPIGLDCSEERLMEHWLIEENIRKMPPLKVGESRNIEEIYPIDMVFSSHGPTISMFRRRGIFVFDCNQRPENEF